MSYYDEEFYNEPSEFEIQVDEFKSSLLKSVKNDFIAEMDRLKKENEELQVIKANFEEIKSEYKKKEYDLALERKSLESKVRRERLSSLMQDFEVVMYRVNSKNEKLPKCDKCDDHRKIKYKTPLGNDAYENCDCSIGKTVFYPHEHICSEFRINENNNRIIAWYKMKTDNGRDYAVWDSSTFAKTIYNEDMKFENINKYDTFFKSEEECQKYCDYLNAEEEE